MTAPVTAMVTGAHPTVPLTAMITAFQRIDAVLMTIGRIRDCDPAPDEILVHVDGGQAATANAIGNAFPGVRVIVSPAPVGPGGGRNRMTTAARHEIVASFDDDSYPIDGDYFRQLMAEFDRFPDAWVIDARVFHLHETDEPPQPRAAWVADFTGCGCAYRRSHYLRVGGYVPLPTAYGMEEVDFSLRLHALGGRVLRSDRLRVRHHTDLAHHVHPAVTSASIANLALLAYLRYPLSMWLVGAAQCANRIQWLLRHGRWRGITAGLLAIPGALADHRKARAPVAAAALVSYLRLRRKPVLADHR